MKACFVDSNILIGYLYSDHLFHQLSTQAIQTLIANNDSIYLSTLVIDEVLYGIMKNSIILQKLPRKTALVQAKSGLRQVLKIPNVKLVNPPIDRDSQLKIINIMDKFSLRPRDAYHLLTIKHHLIKYFATLDHDFDLVFQKTSLKPFPQTPTTV